MSFSIVNSYRKEFAPLQLTLEGLHRPERLIGIHRSCTFCLHDKKIEGVPIYTPSVVHDNDRSKAAVLLHFLIFRLYSSTVAK